MTFGVLVSIHNV